MTPIAQLQVFEVVWIWYWPALHPERGTALGANLVLMSLIMTKFSLLAMIACLLHGIVNLGNLGLVTMNGRQRTKHHKPAQQAYAS